MNEASRGVPARTTYSVSELADILRGLLEDSLPSVWVSGEISNFSRPASGHWYFTLKDERAQLRCAMFKNTNYYVRPQPKDGDAVLVRAKVGIYPARGELQMIVEHLEAAGTGALLRAFEQLKAKLAAEGLFDAALKRPLPKLPRRIGVITSGTGAALQDILNALRRRWPLAEVMLLPVPVQGKEAPPAIIRALRELPLRAPVDVILLARGGGSLEDLWAFNDEGVARAIRACTVPVVSGVGHEIDFTIADFAADLRAATPTAAAELATPDIAERYSRVDTLDIALIGLVNRRLLQLRERLAQMSSRLQSLHPGRRLQERAQRLDELDERLRHAMSTRLAASADRLRRHEQRFEAAAPLPRIVLRQSQLRLLADRLMRAGSSVLIERRARLRQAGALLNSLNPSAVLERGYALATGADGRILRDSAEVNSGERVSVQLARGRFEADVADIQPPKTQKT
ncbi:exodeoxyribonuclease VII large subunit [Nevskia ramosa]|uniref:exodeoxyribonuclease VII large subunit n=1 Tax=Nevskia ramosa TaxID=64002 RepID=UPI002353AA0A|nr:exodeoxyribonuclease VII large subunit [Nevskia ramosa]